MQSLEKPNSEGESSQFRLICKGIVIMQSLETPNSEGESPQFRFLCKWIVIMQSLEMPNSEGESPQFRLICKGIAIMQSLETPNSKEKSSQFQFTCKRIVIMKNEKAFSHMHSLEMSNCKGQSSQFRLICKGIALSHMHSLETPNSKGQSSQFRFIRLLSIPSTTEPYKNPYLRHYFRNTSIENSWLIPEALFRACRQFLGNDLGDQIWVDSSKEVEFELHRSSALLGTALSHMHSLETPDSKGQSPKFRFIRLLSFPSTTEPHKHPYLRQSFRNTSIENSRLIRETLFRACRQFLENDLADQIWVDSSKEVGV
ncbi:hypothetical protein CDAR_512151 [Caerostris darwini]|uniref:Uncharacterized protein n=1 Tax=Caerostris darwini TaxID=1538125 RepID=A0AAV4WJN3_9ARAC|nr:hypothetical protein CDAR_512151 [Caerostris darwini]